MIKNFSVIFIKKFKGFSELRRVEVKKKKKYFLKNWGFGIIPKTAKASSFFLYKKYA